MSYVIMGLLRQRPEIDMKDSALQAFARLSLANDNNMFSGENDLPASREQ